MLFDLQKASFWKRISAFLLDGILLCILSVGFAFLLSFVTKYDTHQQALQNYYDKYEQDYNVDFSLTYEQLEALSPEEKAHYEEVEKIIATDTAFVNEYNLVINLMLVIISFGILLSYIVLEFVLPLVFKNGQTLGKKVFGLGVMRTSGIKMNTVSLFIRTFLGKFAIETMIPVLIFVLLSFNSIGITGTLVVLALVVLQLVLVIATKTNSYIHDILADTVVVDISSQMIFDDENALVKYKESLAKEEANKSTY